MSNAALCFMVPGPPVPKGRPRTFLRGGRPRTITPPKTKAFERKVAQYALVARQEAGWRLLKTGDVALTCYFWPKGKRRFDLDNAIKSVADGLEGVLYANDRQVVEIRGEVCPWTANGTEPRTEVEVERR